MFERFTERAHQVVVLAQDSARGFKHNYIGTEHLLLGLLREKEGLAARVLGSLGVTEEGVNDYVTRVVGVGDQDVAVGQIPFTPRARRALDLALREALSLGHNYIGTEHILLGISREDAGVAAPILRECDADAEKIRDAIIGELSRPRRIAPSPALWERSDVELRQLWAKGDRVLRVLAIADSPTVTLEDIATGTQEHYVIGSLLFAEFERLTASVKESA